MSGRTKILFGVVLLAGAAFLVDKIVTNFWWEAWKKTRDEIVDVDRQLAPVHRTLKDEDKIRKEWRRVRDLLDKPRMPDVQNHFVEHLRQICEKIGATFDFLGGQQGRQGDFKEYVIDFKLKLPWDKFVGLLEEFHNSREFLKPVRINIASKYDKEDQLDVDFRVSTIEFDPQRAAK